MAREILRTVLVLADSPSCRVSYAMGILGGCGFFALGEGSLGLRIAGLKADSTIQHTVQGPGTITRPLRATQPESSDNVHLMKSEAHSY